MFNITEIKSWAKNHGYTIKKKDDGYIWKNDESEIEKPEHINQIVKTIFNKITENKFLEHQANYKPLE